jgi:hypothetical protein
MPRSVPKTKRSAARIIRQSALAKPAPVVIPRELIAAYAYYLWEHEGRPAGRADEHWFQAETQLRWADLHHH